MQEIGSCLLQDDLEEDIQAKEISEETINKMASYHTLFKGADHQEILPRDQHVEQQISAPS